VAEVSGERAGRGADGGSGPATVRLPPRRSSFVGRATELGEIATRLGRYAVVTLVGVGGVGKTALAVEAAWAEVSAGRAELACYVDLVPCHTDDQVIAALVEGVGIRGAPAAAGLDAVVDAVSGGRSLLVIDNCEHVLESVRRACDRLAERVPGLRLLVTSRIPLDVEPECVRRVPPMAVPDEAGPPVVTEAVTLFFARAAMAGATLQDGPAELALASSICRQAAGLPLAIELVANRLRVASLTELASGLGLSQWPARSAGQGRHDSLDACLTWSHALLPADAAVVFRRLSVFPGGFDLAAAQEVAGTQPVKGSQVGALVEQLVTASLLEADTSGTKTRFRFNEPVRQYAAARLAAAGEADLARRRHARAFLARAEVVEPMLFTPQAEQHCDLLEFDRPDHDAAMDWLLASGAARLLGDDVVLARCLATAGYVWWLLDPERSAELFEEGLEAAHRGGDGWTRSTGLAGLGWARYFAGSFDVALDSLGEAIQLTARSGRRQQFAMAILGRAAVELSRGQLAAADASAQQALGVLRAIGDASWTSAALAVGAEIERARGRLEAAGRHAAEAIEVARRANSVINVMIGTGHLGRILLAGGGPGAGDYLDQAVQLARAFAVRPLVAWWLDSLGELAELEGRYDDARSWYEQGAGHAAECGLPVDAARARHHRARLAWLQGDQASAVNGCHEALAGQLNAADHLGLVETLETLGACLWTKQARAVACRCWPPPLRPGTHWVSPGGPRRPAGSRAGSRRAASSSASRRSQRGHAAPGLALRRLPRWPAGDGVRAAGPHSGGRASPRPSAMWPISSPAA
jgi:predicted ATPase